MSTTTHQTDDDLFWDADESTTPLEASSAHHHDAASTIAVATRPRATDGLSLFESIITTYPPILESLLAQLPTSSVLDLYHTSRHLRSFLSLYPLAWKTLSFRLPQPAIILGSPGNETPDGRERQSKQYALDGLLIQIVVPFATRLKNLDLCNTAVSGVALTTRVLQPRINTIEHLSVRGCKNVSIKYHLVPFLEPYSQQVPWANRNELALKSLYAYRCRHHRRRPYLPSSLVRRDSDSEPTHQLIEICHALGIWTDTAWCPTPAGRCFRRKDYHNGRAAPGSPEVWVPFDRLWRSGNRIGPLEEAKSRGSDGRLWEDAECGHDGEPLGPSGGAGEGKDVPAHLRWSHRTFVQEIKCSQCGDHIPERCEQCSVRMHCMGCRKTLCASCAFNRPLPRKKQKTRHFATLAFGNNIPAVAGSGPASMALSSAASVQNRQPASPKSERFWWAPGATRSPNLMQEMATDEDESDSDDAGNALNGAGSALNALSPLKLNMSWCCLEPIFSGGGGIAFLGPGLGGRGADRIRAAPLPRAKNWEDPDFVSPSISLDRLNELKHSALHKHILGDDMDIIPFLQQESLDLQANTCPRSLCQDCYRTFRWKVSCRGCKKPLCKEHDFRALKVRRCGFRDLMTEREFIRNYKEERTELEIPAFRRTVSQQTNFSTAESSTSSTPLSQESSTNTELPGLQPPKLLDLPHLAGPSNLNMSSSMSEYCEFGPLVSRPRSLSVSNLRSRPAVTWTAAPKALPRVPLPGHPRHPVQWEGCGAYFCQYPRAIGDSRARCPAVVKECKGCGVNVCNGCLQSNPPCTCAFCTTNYHCPVCASRPAIKGRCRLQEETKARLENIARERARREKEREAQRAADELAEKLGDFFSGLNSNGTTAGSHQQEQELALAATTPLPEPVEEGHLEGGQPELASLEDGLVAAVAGI